MINFKLRQQNFKNNFAFNQQKNPEELRDLYKII